MIFEYFCKCIETIKPNSLFMDIYIVRHGETEENKQKILQGHLPGNLTEKGREQVRITAEELVSRGVEFRCILSSDLKRAMDSATIISERLQLLIIPMEILRERDWGQYTGLSLAEGKEKYYHDGHWDFPGMAETDEGIFSRAKETLMLLSEQYSDSSIIVVTHGQFARNLFAANMDCSYHDIPSYANAEVRVLHL